MTAPATPASVPTTPAILPCHSAHLVSSKPNTLIPTSGTINDAATDAPDAYPFAFKTTFGEQKNIFDSLADMNLLTDLKDAGH